MSAEAKFWANLYALETVLEPRLTIDEALEVTYTKNQLKGMSRNNITGIPASITEPINRIAEEAGKRKQSTGSLDNRFVWGKT